MMRALLGFLLGLSCALVSPAFAADPSFRDYPKEWYLQRQVFRNISPNAVWRDDVLARAAHDITRRLETGAGLPKFFAETTVTSCSEARAAVYSGGWVEVCLPLLLSAETQDEIAFVLAHEISHIIADHLPQNPNNFYQPSAAEELLADRMGLRMAVAAGYSPDGAFSFFDKVRTGDARAQETITDRRNALADIVEREFAAESDEREFALFAPEFSAAQQVARDYLGEMEQVFSQTVAMVQRRSKSADGYASAAECNKVFAALGDIHKRYGFIELTIHAAAGANYWCRTRDGVTDSFRRMFMNDVRIDAMSYSLLGMIAVTRSIDPSGGVGAIMLDEFHRRAFMNPENYPSLRGMPAMKNRALFSSARFLAGCRAVGYMDEEWALKRYAELTPALRNSLLSVMKSPNGVTYVLNECANSINYARNEKRRNEKSYYDARIAAGYSPQESAALADDMARHWSALIYVRDSWAVNNILRND